MKVFYKITYKCLFFSFSVLFQNSVSESRNNKMLDSIKTFTNFIYFLLQLLLLTCMFRDTHILHVEVRGQLARVSFLLLPCEAQGLNSGRKCVYPLLPS